MKLNSSFDINSEKAKFDINYKEYLLNNPSLLKITIKFLMKKMI